MASDKPGLGTSIVEALACQFDASVGTSDAEPSTIMSVRRPPVAGTEAPVKGS